MTKRLAIPAVLCLAIPALALAATPKLPATFSGGGGGSPVSFKLDKHGNAKSGFFAFSCQNTNGIGTASTEKKHKPKGKVAHGKITITYLANGGGVVGTVKATIKATFTSKTHAKGTTSISGGNCKSPPRASSPPTRSRPARRDQKRDQHQSQQDEAAARAPPAVVARERSEQPRRAHRQRDADRQHPCLAQHQLAQRADERHAGTSRNRASDAIRT
jgi:hypothetical protein